MYTITKEFRFSAAHSLPHLPRTDHPCRRVHGHSYLVRVELMFPMVDAYGMVEEYGELNDIRDYIESILDHKNLNEVLSPMHTTAENLARYLFDTWKPDYPKLSAVTICEEPGTSATYREFWNARALGHE